MTCIRGLSNYINVSASDKQIVPIQSILGNIQAIFPSTTFTCNGIINQITGWYQVHVMDDLNNSMIVPATINLQIWHPISDSQYKLVSETSFPSALDDNPRTVNNLTMQFTVAVFWVYTYIPLVMGQEQSLCLRTMMYHRVYFILLMVNRASSILPVPEY